MAVVLGSVDGFSLLTKAGVSSTDQQWLKSAGIEIIVTLTFVAFVHTESGDAVASVTQPWSKLKPWLKAEPSLSTSVISKQFVNAVASIKEGNVSPVSAMDLLKSKSAKPAPKAPAAQAPQSGSWPYFDSAKLKTAEPVKLRDATHMYQPVKGSSGGSRYFMVAANEDLRIAARLKTDSLSIRIEGPNWEKHKSAIQKVGFDNVNGGKGYASMHLHVGTDKVMASKALGAVLLGLGVALQTPLPDLAVIAGKGG